MQGRLSKSHNNLIQSFPINSWREEFKVAKKCGYDVIEWIYDELQPNPISTSEGISEINLLMKKHDISINSICADYFMTKKLFNESQYELKKNINILNELIIQAGKLEISMIEIPLVDSSSLKTNENKTEIKNNLEKVISHAENNNVNIVLETDLNPYDFKEFLMRFSNQKIMANYDSGNSASLGYNSKDELTILKKWIKNIHVKDRKFQGNTVPFGMGDTNFEQFFSTLSEINYVGDLIIQGARFSDKKISPETTCKTYNRFVKRYVDKYYV
ncbi:Putative L-xylulose-5-phosphate 3-epimerase [Candidatus Nitrosarchaeum limnium SFB1]|uniref:Putative L-xylulose-5-phosphate 3-epimerase n=1 Tax=Candidatus Nitrosarchaeum limnium SFB1 TaxID=886738 RepID=F3KMZ9_9ARCH|nr:Putative L-xylulose-5-phosphate 3-epimerase [Candidatus Nitrosarchaeum limnium SFB1]